MYFMSKVEACYEKYQSELRKLDPEHVEPHINQWKPKDVDWREEFASNMLLVYPELRAYCLELEARVMQLQREISELRTLIPETTEESDKPNA